MPNNIPTDLLSTFTQVSAGPNPGNEVPSQYHTALDISGAGYLLSVYGLESRLATRSDADADIDFRITIDGVVSELLGTDEHAYWRTPRMGRHFGLGCTPLLNCIANETLANDSMGRRISSMDERFETSLKVEVRHPNTLESGLAFDAIVMHTWHVIAA